MAGGQGLSRIWMAGACSMGAGVIHAAAIGAHSDHPASARVFVVLSLLQIGWGLAALSGSDRVVVIAGSVLHAGALAGWVVTRTVGIGLIGGLEIAEAPQTADTVAAGLAALALLFASVRGPVVARLTDHVRLVGSVATVLTIAGLITVGSHDHGHGNPLAESAFVIDDSGVIVSKDPGTASQDPVPSPVIGESTTSVAPADSVPSTSSSGQSAAAPRTTTTTRAPATTTTSTTAHPHPTTAAAVLAAASGWPRVWDPSVGLDVMSGVGGVTAEQEARAKALVTATMRDLPTWSDPAVAEASGWKSIGDSSTGYEHYVNTSLVNDGRFLDTKAPESLVYRVENGRKTLVSAMFMAPTGTSMTDPMLTEYAGPLMQWHIHDNLCFTLNASGNPVVAGVTDAAGRCPALSVRQTNGSAMVHVWIAAHPCGPFAAVEGVAAGVAAVPDAQRLDLCSRH